MGGQGHVGFPNFMDYIKDSRSMMGGSIEGGTLSCSSQV